jgi:hypothetical protein
MKQFYLIIAFALFAMIVVHLPAVNAQEPVQVEQEEEREEGGQSRESMANDSSASQWSFQVAYEIRNWREDTLSTGQVRPQGNKNMWQFRIVAPLDKKKTGLGFNILPRLTFRNNEAQDGTSGAGNAELFVLAIPVEWATGRFGIGPQVNFPADDEQYGSKEWRYGFATAWIQRAAKDKILTGILVQQIWGQSGSDASDAVLPSPITIQPIFNYSLPKAFYLNIGETALSYNWQTESWLVPLGVRFGKLFITDRGTWNVYGEYRTTVVYEDWLGSALKDAFRINVSFTIPI